MLFDKGRQTGNNGSTVGRAVSQSKVKGLGSMSLYSGRFPICPWTIEVAGCRDEHGGYLGRRPLTTEPERQAAAAAPVARALPLLVMPTCRPGWKEGKAHLQRAGSNGLDGVTNHAQQAGAPPPKLPPDCSIRQPRLGPAHRDPLHTNPYLALIPDGQVSDAVSSSSQLPLRQHCS